MVVISCHFEILFLDEQWLFVKDVDFETGKMQFKSTEARNGRYIFCAFVSSPSNKPFSIILPWTQNYILSISVIIVGILPTFLA